MKMILQKKGKNDENFIWKYNRCHRRKFSPFKKQSKEVLEKCGIEYFKKRERTVVKNCSEYYNNILSIDASLYIEYIDFFDKTFVIYLKLDKENVSKVVDKISFDKYDEFLKTNSEIVVELSNKKTADAVKKIINLMGEKLWI